MRILIVEDENTLADVVSSSLKKEGYILDIVNDGEVGYFQGITNIYDLIILDVMLPNMDGFTILKKLKEEGINSKIIMLTAKSALEDKLEGLENGANDYITKPFHIEEVVARVNNLLKNNIYKNKDVLEYGDLELYLSSSTLKCTTNNEEVKLVCKEFQLLEYFIQNTKQILSKEQIYDKVWGVDNETESNNLEVYLSFIRRKLKAIGSSVTIKSVRGLGYRMEDVHE